MLLFVALIANSLLPTKVKLEDRIYKLLFFLHLLYIIALAMLKQYTDKIHNDLIKANYYSNNLLNFNWISTLVYGIFRKFFEIPYLTFW